MSGHDAYERLIAYAANELSSADAADVEQLIADDEEAAATVWRFRDALAALRSDRSEAPPAASVAAAKALFRVAPVAPSILERLTRVLAELVYDSRRQVTLVGVRGANQGYQLTFESELADIDVQVEPAADAKSPQRRLMGQVSPRNEMDIVQVDLREAGTENTVVTGAVDDGGVFSLETEPGIFDLWVTLADAVLVAPGVEIR